MRLWRLDCGSIEIGDLDSYSDTFLYPDQKATFTVSCYLIRHGDDYMLWDTGLPAELAGSSMEQDGDRLALSRTIKEQLARLGVDPARINSIGISHYHFDHTGQAADFSEAKLLVDRRDWEVIRERKDLSGKFGPWLTGGGAVQPLTYDHDVFGDGSVIILKTPGHTPGHRSLLVRLRETGPVLLSGDAVHFRRNWEARGVPSFNADRAQTLASMERLSRIAASLEAKLVIQHEPKDIAELPAFPGYAR